MSQLYVATTTTTLPPPDAFLSLASEGWQHVTVVGEATHLHQIARAKPLLSAQIDPIWLNLASDDRDRYDRSVAELQEAIRILGDTGARWLAFTPGFAVHGGLGLDGVRDSEKRDRSQARLRLLRALDRLATAADNHGLTLILRQQSDPDNEAMLVDYQDGESLLAAVGAPHLRLGLDLGATKVVAKLLKRDPDEMVEGYLAHAGVVWLNGNEGKADERARPKLESWEMSQLDRGPIRDLPLVYDARNQAPADLRAVVGHLVEQGKRTI
jgi:sugar phosphate isomerase/epimerase